MKRSLLPLRPIVLALVVNLSCFATSRGDEDPEPENGQAPELSGLRVHKAPDTGKLGTPAETLGIELPPPARRALSTSARGLVQKPGLSRARGVGVHLSGRFRSAVVASRTPDGGIELRCLAGLGGLRDEAVESPDSPAEDSPAGDTEGEQP